MDSRINFESLSAELIQNIISFLPPEYHFPLALTSRWLHYHSEPVLRQHRQAHRDFRVTSDLSPLTLPKLLKSALEDGIEAWHVRELEIWGSRSQWNEWRPWSVGLDGKICLNQEPACPPLSGRDIRYFLEESHVSHLMPLDELEPAQVDCEGGDDGFLKMLLITALPRIEVLKFAKRGNDLHLSCKWLSKSISWSIRRKSWPQGLLSLRKVAVGVPVSRDDEDGRDVRRYILALARLLRLPNVEEIYYGDLDVTLEGPEDIDEEGVFPEDDDAEAHNDALNSMTIHNSSVKHITLDRIRGIDELFAGQLCCAPLALESFVARGDVERDEVCRDMDAFITFLAEYQADSLQRLILHPEGLDGFRRNLFYPEELMGYNRLRQVSVNVEDMIASARDKSDTADKPWRRNPALYDEFTEFCLNFLPATIEVLVLWGEVAKKNIHVLEEGVISMIGSERYNRLQAIYLSPVQDMTMLPRFAHHFERAVSAGRENGVQVYTWRNKAAPDSHPQMPLIGLPFQHEMKTAPFGPRDAGWIVDPLSGDWVGPSDRSSE